MKHRRPDIRLHHNPDRCDHTRVVFMPNERRIYCHDCGIDLDPFAVAYVLADIAVDAVPERMNYEAANAN